MAAYESRNEMNKARAKAMPDLVGDDGDTSYDRQVNGSRDDATEQGPGSSVEGWGVKAEEFLWLATTVLVSVGFGLYLGAQRLTDPFLYIDTAFVKSLQNQSVMTVPATGPFATLSFVPGRELLMSTLSNMMGVSPEQLQYLPIGALLISITLYALSRWLLKSPLVAAMVTTYLTINLSHTAALYSVFAYALAMPILMAFIRVSLHMFDARTLQERLYDVLLLLLMFIGMDLIHYTFSSWLLLFLLGANAAIWVGRKLAARRSGTEPRAIPIYYLLAAFLVIFLTFNETIYKSFLPLIGEQSLWSAFERFTSYLSLGRDVTASPFKYTRDGNLGLLSTIPLVMILATVLIGVLSDVISALRKRTLSVPNWVQDPKTLVIWGIVVLGTVDSVSYAVRGSISTKSFSLIFPIVALLYIARLHRRVLLVLAAGLLLGTSVAKAGVFYSQSYIIGPQVQQVDSASMAASDNWLGSHSERPDYTLLADLSLYGRYLERSANASRLPRELGLKQDYYQWIVDDNRPSPFVEGLTSHPDYVAIDTTTQEPVVGFVFQLFQPLSDFKAQVRANSHLNVIYDGGSVWLGSPVYDGSSALSHHADDSELLPPSSPTLAAVPKSSFESGGAAKGDKP